MVSTNLFAKQTGDIAGGKDYPLVSRFKDSHIVWHNLKQFDRYYILLLKGNKLHKKEIDGKIIRIQYESQKRHSVFEIYKSYEIALKQGGFKILLTLNKRNCGVNLSEQLYISEFNGLNALTGNYVKPDYRYGKFVYLLAKKKINNKEVYVVVYITYYKKPLINFDAIEVKTISKGLVSVKDMETGIKQNGHIAIYDIHFDSGKSTIKSESSKALKIIAKYLNSHKNKKYIIVGHTDNKGSFEFNLKLSKKRAEAVKNELVSKYSVKASQLITYGVGQTAPIATNSTKEGKAKNRRVEIVKQ